MLEAYDSAIVHTIVRLSMTDKESYDLPTRLHFLRHQHGLTVHEMASRCGLPKSSLESYMKSTGAKRPGVDALVAIADAFDVSVDWIIGRGRIGASRELSAKDYAMVAYNGMLAMMDKHEIFAGLEENKHEIAALALLEFMESAETLEKFSNRTGQHRRAISDDLVERVIVKSDVKKAP